jgi:3-phenylpropionate/trans-cinnamate dioxygenase ferredoxin component
MAEYVSVAKASDLEDGEIRVFDIDGQIIAVACVEGSFYAFDDTCTHEMCSLSEGDLDGTTVICPCHEGEYDITTGEVLDGPPPEPIATYPVRVEDDEILVEVVG